MDTGGTGCGGVRCLCSALLLLSMRADVRVGLSQRSCTVGIPPCTPHLTHTQHCRGLHRHRCQLFILQLVIRFYRVHFCNLFLHIFLILSCSSFVSLVEAVTSRERRAAVCSAIATQYTTKTCPAAVAAWCVLGRWAKKGFLPLLLRFPSIFCFLFFALVLYSTDNDTVAEVLCVQ